MADTALIGEGVKFQRIRRISGYLVGTTDRWNYAKLCELEDRVKHGGVNDERQNSGDCRQGSRI